MGIGVDLETYFLTILIHKWHADAASFMATKKWFTINGPQLSLFVT